MPFNQTSHDDVDCEGTYNQNVVPVLYFLIFPISMLLNGAAAWVSVHLKSTSTFVVYLKHLIAADIIMTLIIPVKAASEIPGASKTLFILSCYISPLFYGAQYTCISLLGIISLDRFFKIVTPQSKLFGQNLTISKLVSVSAWVTIIASTSLPNIIFSNKSAANMTKIGTCMNLKGPAGLKFHEKSVISLNLYFWLVSMVIVVCYICITNKVIQSFRNSGSNNNQGKQRIKLRVFLVVIVFFVSFGPYHIVRIPYTFQQVKYSSILCFNLKGKFSKELSLWFATTNICMNPLLYIFLCREFKEKLTSMMKNVFISFKEASASKADGAPAQRS